MHEPRELDIKLGKSSASKRELQDKAGLMKAVLKKQRHKVLDRLTNSHLFGFRIEGVSGWSGKKLDLMRAPTQDIWKMFFPNESIKTKVLQQIAKIIQIVEQHRDQLYMIGSSILILHDNSKVVVKLIDFEHCEIGKISKSETQQQKVIERYLAGLVSLHQNIATH